MAVSFSVFSPHLRQINAKVYLLFLFFSRQDPADAHARRGAHDTFDSQRFVQFVQALRQGSSIADIDLPSRSTFESNDNASPSETFPTDLPSHPPVLLAPTFSHADKDPVPSSLPIHLHYQLIILEGLYLALSVPPWDQAAKLLDEIILIEVEESVARERVIRRHVGAGLCKDEVDAGRRADENDMPSEWEGNWCRRKNSGV